MSPIKYIEARCDICNDEIYSGFSGVEFALLRNGNLLCKACGNLTPDQVFKWFSIAPLPDEPEEEPDLIPDEDRPEDPTIVDTSGEFEGDVDPDKEPEDNE